MNTESNTCKRCGATITLVHRGTDHYMWVTKDKQGAEYCNTDPERPVLVHEPANTEEV